jgi:hypothetical protein
MMTAGGIGSGGIRRLFGSALPVDTGTRVRESDYRNSETGIRIRDLDFTNPVSRFGFHDSAFANRNGSLNP